MASGGPVTKELETVSGRPIYICLRNASIVISRNIFHFITIPNANIWWNVEGTQSLLCIQSLPSRMYRLFVKQTKWCFSFSLSHIGKLGVCRPLYKCECLLTYSTEDGGLWARPSILVVLPYAISQKIYGYFLLNKFQFFFLEIIRCSYNFGKLCLFRHNHLTFRELYLFGQSFFFFKSCNFLEVWNLELKKLLLLLFTPNFQYVFWECICSGITSPEWLHSVLKDWNMYSYFFSLFSLISWFFFLKNHTIIYSNCFS